MHLIRTLLAFIRFALPKSYLILISNVFQKLGRYFIRASSFLIIPKFHELIVPGKLVSLESITIAAVIPVHNPKEAWFRELIESLKGNMFEEIIFLYSGANV